MNHLKEALAASLESDETPVVGATPEAQLSELIEVAEVIESEAPSVSAIVEQGVEVNTAAGVLDDIAETAAAVIDPDAPTQAVGLEALSYALTAVMNSHGAKLTASSMESNSKEEHARNVIDVASNAANNLRKSYSVAVESFSADVRDTIKAQLSVVGRARSSLGSARNAIASRSKELEATPVELNHLGIYDFLHRGGALVPDLGTALKPDIEVMERIAASLKGLSTRYDQVASNTDYSSEAGIQKFARDLAAVGLDNAMTEFEGIMLLSNGQIEIDRNIDDTAESMSVIYTASKNDGSKAGLGARIKGALIAGGPGALLAGGFGLMVGGPVGAVVGAGLIGGLAAAGGVRAADYRVRGSETNTQYSVDGVIEFLKDAQKLCDLTNEINGYLNTAINDNNKLRNYLKGLLATLEKDNVLSTVAINVLATVAVAALTRGQGTHTRVKSRNEQIRDAMTAQLDQIEIGYLSMVNAIATHTFTCVKGAMEVGNAILRSETK